MFRAGRDRDFKGLIHLFCTGAISGSLVNGMVAIGSRQMGTAISAGQHY